jgi:glycosyltransferase involved in cell wall biosynthesis
MRMAEEERGLTVVIPARNEEKLIARLLFSLAQQTYPIEKIYLADANSTDGTRSAAWRIASAYNLPLEVIPGGLPSVGRNAGAVLTTTRYVLFMDADVELATTTVIEDAVARIERGLYLVTTDLKCPTGRITDRFFYFLANLSQRASKYLGMCFATGMFMLWETEAFRRLGPFDEEALFAEDYMISKRVPGRHFAVVPGGVYTTNRRFLKMGLLPFFWLFVKSIFLGGNDEYFKRDQNYW